MQSHTTTPGLCRAGRRRLVGRVLASAAQSPGVSPRTTQIRGARVHPASGRQRQGDQKLKVVLGSMASLSPAMSQ